MDKVLYSFSIGFFVTLVVSFANESQGPKACPNLCSIYQFGDSISDTGNLIRIPGIGLRLPPARPPYGETYGKPTGRYSNGLLIIDYFALAVGLPLLHPYLDKDANFSNGVNFAVGGSTALDFPFFTARGVYVPSYTSPLYVQINTFKHYLGSRCSSPKESSIKLARSLFFVGEIGINDLNFAYKQGKSIEEVRTYIPFIIEAIINSTREVILFGARRIVVPGNFPLGCLPEVLTLVTNANASHEEFDKFGCSKSYNDLAMYQNHHLQIALASLRIEFPHVKLVYADYYGAFISVLARASLLGFDTGGGSLLKACCGIGGKYNYNNDRTCGSPGVPVCPNSNRYLHWDGLHLTQETYRLIAKVITPNILSQIDCLCYVGTKIKQPKGQQNKIKIE